MFLLEDFIYFENNIGDKNTIKYLLSQNECYGTTVYGFRLEMLNLEQNVEDFEEISNVTDNLDFAKIIFKSLKDYSVTPMSLINVLDDFITLNEDT